MNDSFPLNGEITSDGKEILLSLKNVDITFKKQGKKIKVVNDATFDVYKGETFSIVGESGSGKTTIGRAIIRVNPCSSGDILYKGVKISGKISNKLDKEVIKNIQMVFQDPAASLNERATVEYIVSEGLYNFRLYKDENDRIKKVEKIIKDVGLLPEHLYRYPHEFSGGQRQRIGIARSIVMEPELIIADEPISALDVSIRAQILNLLNKFKKERNLTTIFIAHDLSIVRFISDRIAVIYKGNIVEIAEAEELFNYPLHPYTMSLISAIPIPDPILEKKKTLFTYNPDMHDYSENEPSLVDIGNNHLVFGNEKEIIEYKRRREEEIDYRIIMRRLSNNQKIYKDEQVVLKPIMDLGTAYYSLLSFLIPFLGLVLMLVFKRKGYIKNYKSVKNGLLANGIVTIGIIGIFFLALASALI